MHKFVGILKDEKGQGMLEYVVAVGGIVLIAAAILGALKLGVVGADGKGGATTSVGKVTDKINSVVTTP